MARVRSVVRVKKRAVKGPVASVPETWNTCHIRYVSPLFYFRQWPLEVLTECWAVSFHTRKGRGTWCICNKKGGKFKWRSYYGITRDHPLSNQTWSFMRGKESLSNWKLTLYIDLSDVPHLTSLLLHDVNRTILNGVVSNTNFERRSIKFHKCVFIHSAVSGLFLLLSFRTECGNLWRSLYCTALRTSTCPFLQKTDFSKFRHPSI